MKKIVAIILISVCTLILFCGCKPAEEMGNAVETMISTILSTESRDKTDNNVDNGVNGTINDNDGYIGNENSHTSNMTTNSPVATSANNMTDDNVI